MQQINQSMHKRERWRTSNLDAAVIVAGVGVLPLSMPLLEGASLLSIRAGDNAPLLQLLDRRLGLPKLVSTEGTARDPLMLPPLPPVCTATRVGAETLPYI